MNLPIIRVRDEQGNLVDIPGIIGPPGKTPVKGEDYWTAEDKAEMVRETAAAIPAPDVSGAISQHNADKSAHADIREAIQLLEEHTHTPEALGAAPAEHGHDYVSESRVNELLGGGGFSRVEIKSYTGNGRQGQTYPVSLTFSFAPKYLRVINPYERENSDLEVGAVLEVLCSNITTSYTQKRGFESGQMKSNSVYHPYMKKSADGKTFYWYHVDEYVGHQMNKSGQIYDILAIG